MQILVMSDILCFIMWAVLKFKSATVIKILHDQSHDVTVGVDVYILSDR